MEFEGNGSCSSCYAPCYIECGVSYAVLTYRGEDHRCPENDEGFFEEDVTICDGCRDLDDQDS